MSALFFLFPLLWSGIAQASQLLDRVVAVVGDQPILSSEVSSLAEQIQKSPVLANIYQIKSRPVSSEEVMNRVLEEKIVHAAITELEMPVAESEVEAQIAGIAKQNQLSLAQLKSSLEKEGVPFDLYKKNIRASLERRNVFDRELRRGGGITESELRDLYTQRAQVELKLVLIQAKNEPTLRAIKTQIQSESLSLEKIESLFPTEALGWIPPASLESKAGQLLKDASPGSVVGPIKFGTEPQLVFVADKRTGSEEEFQKLKPSLTQEAQSADYEKRFAAWLERKKVDMHIVMNPL